nr:serine/threonine-protein phosphatase [Clostridia bacterium]
MFYSGMSDIGRRRSSNQDTFRTVELEGQDNSLLAVVCDGMGGMNGGNIASQLAVENFTAAFSDWFKKNGTAENLSESPVFEEDDEDEIRPFKRTSKHSDTVRPAQASRPASNYRYRTVSDSAMSPIGHALKAAASEANRAVMKRAAEDKNLEGMGTTLLAACFAGETMHIANVGDCRLYLICGEDIRRVTHDHSYVQYLIDMGELKPEEAENSPYRNIITRAVGREEALETDIFTLPMANFNGYILMCSDGLYNFLSEDEIVMVVNAAVKGAADMSELDQKVQTLIRRANENGGGDNITAVLIKYKQ